MTGVRTNAVEVCPSAAFHLFGLEDHIDGGGAPGEHLSPRSLARLSFVTTSVPPTRHTASASRRPAEPGSCRSNLGW